MEEMNKDEGLDYINLLADSDFVFLATTKDGESSEES